MNTIDPDQSVKPIKEITEALWDYIYSKGDVKLTTGQDLVIDALLTKIKEVCDENLTKQPANLA